MGPVPQKIEQICAFSIPDESVEEWREVYLQIGMSDSEVEDCLIQKNRTYAWNRLKKFVKQEMELILPQFQREKRRQATREEQNSLATWIFENLRPIPLKDLERGVRP